MTKWYLKWRFKIRHFGVFLVFLAEDTQFLGHLPVDRQVRVVEQYTAVRLGMVGVVALVGEDRLIAQHREPVREPARNKKLPFVLFVQLHAEPLSEGRTAFAQIDGYIQHAADGAAYEFRLRVRGALEVQSAHHAVAGAGLVILHKMRIDTGLAVALFVVGLYKVAA